MTDSDNDISVGSSGDDYSTEYGDDFSADASTIDDDGGDLPGDGLSNDDTHEDVPSDQFGDSVYSADKTSQLEERDPGRVTCAVPGSIVPSHVKIPTSTMLRVDDFISSRDAIDNDDDEDVARGQIRRRHKTTFVSTAATLCDYEARSK